MTLATFYIRVLRELGVVPPGGVAEAEDRQRVVDIYPQIHAMLRARGLGRWGVLEAIPEEYAIPVIKITAYQLTSDFAVDQTKYALLRQDGEIDATPISQAERTLRKMQAAEYVPSRLASEYF